jgi:hypothetical protein
LIQGFNNLSAFARPATAKTDFIAAKRAVFYHCSHRKTAFMLHLRQENGGQSGPSLRML